MRRLVSLLVATAAVAGVLGGAVLRATPAAAVVPVGFSDDLVTAIAGPTALAFTPDGRMLVTTQPGSLRVLQGGSLLPTPAVDLSGRICSNSERGLLGVAVDPAFTTNGYVFLYYSFNKGGDCGTATVNRVSRFVMTGNSLGGEVVLVDNIPSPAGNHNAGDLQFGKDAKLYVSVGDGGCDYPGGTPSGCGAANDASRDRHSLVGKILRIDRDGGVPADNPFTGTGTARCNVAGGTQPGLICQETFAWGLRNPFRVAFDPNAAGTRLYVNDVGQSTWEEIDLGTAGADYGWNVREGSCATGSTTNCGPPPAGMTNPIFSYGRADGCGSITGGAFVPNGVWPPEYQGRYLFADYNCGKIFRLDPDGAGGFNRIDFATGLGGGSAVHLRFGPWNGSQALYYTTYAAGGQIRRIADTTARATPSVTTHVSPASGTAIAGQAISDTAGVTGVAGGPAPTGTVTFTAFFDPPGAGACSGPPQSLGPVSLTAGTGAGPPQATAVSPTITAAGPGTYRFTVAYSGDGTYAAVPPTACGAPGEEVVVTATTGRYAPVTPARVLDTRDGTGGVTGPVGSGATVDVQLTGRGGVPASGVSAVAINVTVTQPTTAGFLTLFPSGDPRPLAANITFAPGQTVPNLVVVKAGGGGKVALFNSSGATHVVFDVAGWYSDVGTGNDGRFQPLAAARILDTRDGTGGGVRLGPGASLDLQVTGRGGVPASGVEAAVLNLAATGTTATSFLTVHPTGEARPLAANLNFVAGDTVSNRVMAKLGSGGRVTIYNHAGSADLVVDVGGWYTDASTAGAPGAYAPHAPARILDTRDGTGGISGARGAGSTVDVQVAGGGGVPPAGARAVILNVTVAAPQGGGWLTVFPAGAARPLASDLNYAPGATRSNLVVAQLGAGGRVSVFTAATTDVVFDVTGWFS